MVDESEKQKDDSYKQYGNGEDESDVEVQGQETIATGGTFGGYN